MIILTLYILNMFGANFDFVHNMFGDHFYFVLNRFGDNFAIGLTLETSQPSEAISSVVKAKIPPSGR